VLGGEGAVPQGLVSGEAEGGRHAVADRPRLGWDDEARADEAVGRRLVAAAAAVEEEVGLRAQLKLRSARGNGAQDRSVAPAQSICGGHDGLR